MDIFEVLQVELYDQTIQQWIIATLIFVLILLIVQLVKMLAIGRLEARAERTEGELANFLVNFIKQTQVFFVLGVAIYAAALALILPENIGGWVRSLVLTVFLLQVAFWASTLINFLVIRRARAQAEEGAGSVTTLNAFGLIGKVLVWSIIILLILENITGMQVNSLIASLGITGIAVALAVQNILSDLFASLSIALDKPFVLGDTIEVGEFQGTVENIGLKSTRVRSLSGEQLVFANSDLLESRIRNYKRMARRRIVQSIGVDYETTREQLQRLPKILEEIIDNQELATFERAHLKDFGDSGILFELVYFMETPDIRDYMDTRQAIHMEILQRFQEESVEMASPTQYIVLKREDGKGVTPSVGLPPGRSSGPSTR